MAWRRYDLRRPRGEDGHPAFRQVPGILGSRPAEPASQTAKGLNLRRRRLARTGKNEILRKRSEVGGGALLNTERGSLEKD